MIESSVGGVAPAFSVSRIIDPGAALVILPLFVFPCCELLVLALCVCVCGDGDNGDCVETMPKDVSQGDSPRPFPGEYGPDGFATQYIKLYVALNKFRAFLFIWYAQGRPH